MQIVPLLLVLLFFVVPAREVPAGGAQQTSTPDEALFDNGLISFHHPSRITPKVVPARVPVTGGVPAAAALLLDFAPDAFLVIELVESVADPEHLAAIRADALVDEISARLANFGFPVGERVRMQPGTAEVMFDAPILDVRFTHGAGVNYVAGGEHYAVETRLYPVPLGTAILTVAHPATGTLVVELLRCRDRIANDLARPSIR